VPQFPETVQVPLDSRAADRRQVSERCTINSKGEVSDIVCRFQAKVPMIILQEWRNEGYVIGSNRQHMLVVCFRRFPRDCGTDELVLDPERNLIVTKHRHGECSQ
jgi:hypothetical protein